jgi:hypothetical protein
MYREEADMNRGLVRRSNLWIAALLFVAVLPLAACQGADEEAAAREEPAKVEPLEGTDDLNRITLTAEAAERLDVQTAAVRAEGEGTTVIPYSAVLYEPNGETWAYTSHESLTFVRAHIVVETIEGDRAVLSEGPPLGTMVVTVGVAELFGAENGIGADSGH